nr:immunoglobulin heavy chain junction region [Mus musculus]
CENWGPWFAYW